MFITNNKQSQKKRSMEISVKNADSSVQINEELTATDAYKIINSFLDAKIQYYNFKYLQDWEKDHNTEVQQFKDKIDGLKAEKARIKELVARANSENKLIALSGSLELKAIE